MLISLLNGFICFCVLKVFLKKINFFFIFFFKLIYFLVFLDHFDVLISKIILKKYYFNIFLNEKYLKKQP